MYDDLFLHSQQLECMGKQHNEHKKMILMIYHQSDTGGSCLSQIFWEHEDLSGLLVIWLIYIKLYSKRKKMAKNLG